MKRDSVRLQPAPWRRMWDGDIRARDWRVESRWRRYLECLKLPCKRAAVKQP